MIKNTTHQLSKTGSKARERKWCSWIPRCRKTGAYYFQLNIFIIIKRILTFFFCFRLVDMRLPSPVPPPFLLQFRHHSLLRHKKRGFFPFSFFISSLFKLSFLSDRRLMKKEEPITVDCEVINLDDDGDVKPKVNIFFPKYQKSVETLTMTPTHL